MHQPYTTSYDLETFALSYAANVKKEKFVMDDTRRLLGSRWLRREIGIRSSFHVLQTFILDQPWENRSAASVACSVALGFSRPHCLSVLTTLRSTSVTCFGRVWIVERRDLRPD